MQWTTHSLPEFMGSLDRLTDLLQAQGPGANIDLRAKPCGPFVACKLC